MQTKAFYTEQPAPIHYMALPSGDADLWLRKNITQITDPETKEVLYEADEVYMRTAATEAEVEADFEGFYETAAAWQPPQPEKPRTPEERITELEDEISELKKALQATKTLLEAQ